MNLFFFSRDGTSVTLMSRGDWRNAGPLIEIMTEAQKVRNQNNPRYVRYRLPPSP